MYVSLERLEASPNIVIVLTTETVLQGYGVQSFLISVTLLRGHCCMTAF